MKIRMPERNTISFLTLKLIDVFAGAVLCGKGTVSPQCSLCPKLDDKSLTDWCDGNCETDKLTGLCQEKCKYYFYF